VTCAKNWRLVLNAKTGKVRHLYNSFAFSMLRASSWRAKLLALTDKIIRNSLAHHQRARAHIQAGQTLSKLNPLALSRRRTRAHSSPPPRSPHQLGPVKLNPRPLIDSLLSSRIRAFELYCSRLELNCFNSSPPTESPPAFPASRARWRAFYQAADVWRFVSDYPRQRSGGIVHTLAMIDSYS
jgi:hypothetical protein